MPNTRSLKRSRGSLKNRVSRKVVKRLRKSRQCRAGRQRVLSRKVKQRRHSGGSAQNNVQKYIENHSKKQTKYILPRTNKLTRKRNKVTRLLQYTIHKKGGLSFNK